MTVDQALQELLATSVAVTQAVIIDAAGAVRGATVGGVDELLGAASARLWEASARSAQTYGNAAIDQLLVDTPDGALAGVSDGTHTIVALTRPRPSCGLVFYDLRICLANAAAAAESR